MAYRVAPAEASGLAPHSVDLATVAQALHWFDLAAFYAEVRRVVRPGGALAAWSYNDAELGDARLDALARRYNYETVGAHWPPEREAVRRGYGALAFPFEELAPPAFAMEQRWTAAEFAGYLRTWSATLRYAAEHGRDPVASIEAELADAWGGPDTRRAVRWPLTLRVGVVEDRAR